MMSVRGALHLIILKAVKIISPGVSQKLEEDVFCQ